MLSSFFVELDHRYEDDSLQKTDTDLQTYYTLCRNIHKSVSQFVESLVAGRVHLEL